VRLVGYLRRNTLGGWLLSINKYTIFYCYIELVFCGEKINYIEATTEWIKFF